MANSQWEYVKSFELPDTILPETFILVRIDGKGFHKFSEANLFAKPNDRRALDLMDKAASYVMAQFRDITLAYGVSDEYSFLLHHSTTLYNRRSAKIVSTIVSTFTSAYLYFWAELMSTPQPSAPPVFDGRAVVYPSERTVKDYFRWRQADCHINNLYNTTFWALVLKGGSTEREAHQRLKGTFSKDKNEILYKEFDIKYGLEEEIFKKGSILVRSTEKGKATEMLHCDLIKEAFWEEHPTILAPTLTKPPS